jgi:uncharacterized membrane protein
MSSRLQASAALLLLSGATELVVFADGHGPVRVGLAFAFLMLVPGWALLRVTGLQMTTSARIGMAVGLSICVDMLVATGLLYARVWSAALGLTVIVAVVVASVLMDLPSARMAIRSALRRAFARLEEFRGTSADG